MSITIQDKLCSILRRLGMFVHDTTKIYISSILNIHQSPKPTEILNLKPLHCPGFHSTHAATLSVHQHPSSSVPDGLGFHMASGGQRQFVIRVV